MTGLTLFKFGGYVVAEVS